MMAGLPACYFCIEVLSETDLTEDLRRFDVPTLILHGDDDQIVPIGASAMLSSKIVEDAELKVYPGAPRGLATTHKGPAQRRPARVHRGVAPRRAQALSDR
jgi:non-heme chloroperoxidase